jgi:hypothetical protein
MAATQDVSAEQFAAITNLYARYNLASDEGDVEGYADCFTEDGHLELLPLGFTVDGRPKLREHKTRDVQGRDGRYRRHWNGSLALDLIAPDTVRGRCYLIAYNGEPTKMPNVADVGVYEDRIVRCSDGKWRFSHRLLKMDATTWKAK